FCLTNCQLTSDKKLFTYTQKCQQTSARGGLGYVPPDRLVPLFPRSGGYAKKFDLKKSSGDLFFFAHQRTKKRKNFWGGGMYPPEIQFVPPRKSMCRPLSVKAGVSDDWLWATKQPRMARAELGGGGWWGYITPQKVANLV